LAVSSDAAASASNGSVIAASIEFSIAFQ
jgi:hypothetical protein